MPSHIINFVRLDFRTDVSEEPSLKFSVLESVVATEFFMLYSGKSNGKVV